MKPPSANGADHAGPDVLSGLAKRLHEPGSAKSTPPW